MKIGVVIGRVGGADGVALETEKWISVLQRMGHETAVLTGDLEAPVLQVSLVPELGFSHPTCELDQLDAFYQQEVDEAELGDRLEAGASFLEKQILRWIRQERIEVLLTENATTLPCHLTMGMALHGVMSKTGIRSISHDHDFHWERGDRYATRYPVVQQIIEECFPARLPNLRHATINSHGQQRLRDDLGISSIVVPNVMDFDRPFGLRDDYNRHLRSSLGCDDADILLFQVTRVVRRKGIETAIEMIHRLDDARIKLVIAGKATDDFREEYLDELAQRASDLGVAEQILFAGDRFDRARGPRANGGTIYSLSDAYAHASACTYFSSYEGFGNAFVEAVAARRPIFVNNYQPVYWPDIGSKGFRTVQIENNQLTDQSVQEVHKVLRSPSMRRDWTEHNFELGLQHFSYDMLEEKLAQLLTW